MAPARFSSFSAFWPFYLGQHRKRLTRELHFLGTNFAAVAILMAALTRRPVYLLYGLGLAYGLAWVSHFFIERNRPATFQYPWWSFAADWKMWALRLTGRLDGELRSLGLKP